MTTVQAIILGIIQGITEFLPISSSGHLVLAEKLLGVKAGGGTLLFVTCLHVGTLVAVVVAMRSDIARLTKKPISRETWLIAAALVPTILIGAVFEELFEHLFETGATLGLEFVITGVILWWMDIVPAGQKTEKTMRTMDALWIGTFQGVAMFPALSRSGLTISAGLWRGMTRTAAGRFSFLLSIPAIFGATLVELEEIWEHPSLLSTTWTPVLVGTLVAAVAGYLGIRGTLWLLQNAKMRWFAVYVWGIAVLVLADQFMFHTTFPNPFS